MVQDIWKHTLKDETSLPENWVKNSGVLVGIDLRDDDGRGRDRPTTHGVGEAMLYHLDQSNTA